MPVAMQPVFSSHVSSIGYDSDTGEMHVQWETGKVSVYSGVPASVADDATKAYSVGDFLKDNVKGRYEHRYAGQ